MTKPPAQLSPLRHRAAQHIKVVIPNNEESKCRIRQVQGRKWSRTHRCWYVPYHAGSFQHLKELFEVTILAADEPKKEECPNPGRGKEPSIPMAPTTGVAELLEVQNTANRSSPKGAAEPQFAYYSVNGERRRKVAGNKILVKRQCSNWLLAYVPSDQAGWVAVMREVPGRKWDPQKTGWRLPNVKESYHILKKQVGLQNVAFGFDIEKNIPDCYEPTPGQPSQAASLPVFEQLNEVQQKAVQLTEERLILRQYSASTMRGYRSALIHLFLFHREKAPECLTPNDVEAYLLHLIRFKKIAESTQNAIINAYKAYAEKVLLRPKEWVNIQRPKKPLQLPNVLSETEVARLIQAASNLKHKLILLLIYSAGLRLGEAVNVRVRDISLERRAIFIKAAKGKKDRYVVLAEAVLPYLKKYQSEHRPAYWLFEGQHGGQYGKTSVQKLFRRALEKSKVNAYATVHTLRHSYATHCVENGFSLALIQEALGHTSLKTTQRYLHVSSRAMQSLRSPLDVLKDRITSKD